MRLSPGDMLQFIILGAFAVLLGLLGLFGVFGDGIWRVMSGLILLLGLVLGLGAYHRLRRG